MSRIRVYELAKELGIKSKDLVAHLQAAGVDVKSHLSYADEAEARRAAAALKRPAQASAVKRPAQAPVVKRPAQAPAPERREEPSGERPQVRARKRAAAPPERPQPAPTPAPAPAPVAIRPKPQPPRPPQRPSGAASGPGGPQVKSSGGGGSARPPQAQAPARRRERGPGGGEQSEDRSSYSRRGGSRGRGRRPGRRRPGGGGGDGDRGGRRDQGPQRPEGPITITGPMLVRDAAALFGVLPNELVKRLLQRGVMATLNQNVGADVLEAVATELELTVQAATAEKAKVTRIAATAEVSEENLVPRPPVVTVMGHVDHGKTSLLDGLRSTSVVDAEAGGITQHIGASTIDTTSGRIVFLDTPGHEAFTAMRARGASITDLVVLVVAADDGVMPQTVEAINHAKAAGVPIVVAMNKMDLPGADKNRVYQQLAAHDLVPEEWGGKTVVVPCSAKTGEGIDTLQEMILLEAELLEIKGDPKAPARGAVVEAKLDRGRGPVATVLLQQGTLRVGDAFTIGTVTGRIRAMLDDRGQEIEATTPAQPVEILGMSEVPQAGDILEAVTSEQQARRIGAEREQQARDLRGGRSTTLRDLSQQAGENEMRQLNLVLKTDVQGSLEAIADALGRLSTDLVSINILHGAAGPVAESDVLLAAAAGGMVIGFGIRPSPSAQKLAAQEGVEIRLYSIIYELLDDLKQALSGLLAPEIVEVELGRAEVRELFKVPRAGFVAGSLVLSGTIRRNAMARLVRDGRLVYSGKVASLRRFKDDVREVQGGYECGIGLENFGDVKPGDIIEVYTTKEVARTLA